MVPFVLLALTNAPTHGYVLANYLADLGFRRAAQDPSVVYRVLRQFAEDDMVTSAWTLGDDAPPGRVYRLTPAGEAYLHERATDLQRQAERIAVFLDRYRQEFPTRGTAITTPRPRPAREPRTAGHDKQQCKRQVADG
jgi:PadR family transcriptional regulator, regulatory protein PadR